MLKTGWLTRGHQDDNFSKALFFFNATRGFKVPVPPPPKKKKFGDNLLREEVTKMSGRRGEGSNEKEEYTQRFGVVLTCQSVVEVAKEPVVVGGSHCTEHQQSHLD